ncbi:DUF4446 family protein [Actinoallomurus acaciae]|uniref:DUF4446 family protein n=1 Tax=Actinoallomurus acaciae TaxID=502577 RepID=A0ABV5YM56_9ACTN
MIHITLALIGIILGGLGLYAGLTARKRAVQAFEECAEMMRRQLQVTSGAGDNRAIRDVAIVHYDALKESSAGLSFSVAMLNALGDGVVLTSINGRTEARTYARVIQGGRSQQVLSPEEDHVVRAARLGRGPAIRLDERLDVRVNGQPSSPS